MRLLFDINHPSHFHFFKHLISWCDEERMDYVISIRDKDCLRALMNHAGLQYIQKGKGSGNLFGKSIYFLISVVKLVSLIRQHKPDILLSFASPYLAFAGWWCRKKVYTVDDTDNDWLLHAFYQPFSSRIITPLCFTKDFGTKHHRFPGYKELAYLHPSQFMPNSSIFEELNLSPEEPFVILRITGKGATHDLGKKSIPLDYYARVIGLLQSQARVYVSSEVALPQFFIPYLFPLPSHKLHDAMYYSRLVFGQSATMAAEATVMGNNAIFLDHTGRCYTTDLAKRYDNLNLYPCTPKGLNDALTKATGILQTRQANKQENLRKKIANDHSNPLELLKKLMT